MYDTCTEYLTFYKKYAKDLWDHLTPLQYLILLTAVGVIGFLMMLKSPKRIG